MKEENRIRKDLDNETIGWWLRSAYSDSRDYFVAYVHNNGCVYIGDYIDYGGVVPSFII